MMGLANKTVAQVYAVLAVYFYNIAHMKQFCRMNDSDE